MCFKWVLYNSYLFFVVSADLYITLISLISQKRILLEFPMICRDYIRNLNVLGDPVWN